MTGGSKLLLEWDGGWLVVDDLESAHAEAAKRELGPDDYKVSVNVPDGPVVFGAS